MIETTQKSRNAIATPHAEPGSPPPAQSLWERVRELFRGPDRWLSLVVFVGILGFAVFTIVAAVRFFQAEGVQEMLAWAAGFGLGLIAITAGRLWLWMEMHTNMVIREVRWAHAQLARQVSELKKVE